MSEFLNNLIKDLKIEEKSKNDISGKIKLFKITVLKLEQNYKKNSEQSYNLIQYLKDINLHVEKNSNTEQKKEKNEKKSND